MCIQFSVLCVQFSESHYCIGNYWFCFVLIKAITYTTFQSHICMLANLRTYGCFGLKLLWYGWIFKSRYDNVMKPRGRFWWLCWLISYIAGMIVLVSRLWKRERESEREIERERRGRRGCTVKVKYFTLGGKCIKNRPRGKRIKNGTWWMTMIL